MPDARFYSPGTWPLAARQTAAQRVRKQSRRLGDLFRSELPEGYHRDAAIRQLNTAVDTALMGLDVPLEDGV